MGTLVAMAYPTDLALGAADHTYVKCGNGGKAWGCWGGETGGKEIKRGAGSTARADAIAGHDEKAGISCYLVNGVCHQCANRILLPANLTVDNARGYRVSEAIFGVYGIPRALFGLCKAPFNQFPEVEGDIPECAMSGPMGRMRAARAVPADPFLRRIKALYGEARTLPMTARLSAPDTKEFMVKQFEVRLDYSGPGPAARRGQMVDLRARTVDKQLELQKALQQGGAPRRKYPAAVDRVVADFQRQAAKRLTPAQYRDLFQLKRGEVVKLGDPKIVSLAYGR